MAISMGRSSRLPQVEKGTSMWLTLLAMKDEAAAAIIQLQAGAKS
jgi:hypothetical protein